MKVVDQDATFAYSRIVAVEMDGLAEIKVFPNPATRELSFMSKVPIVNYKIINPAGLVVVEKTRAETNKVTFRLPEITAGLYLLQLTQNDGSVHTKQVIIAQ